MNIKWALTALIIFGASTVYAQHKKNYFPLWTFHQNDINIQGISVGLASLRDKPKNTNTNGIRLEILGAGGLVPLIPRSPVAEDDSTFQKFKLEPISENVNGLNLSLTGTVCDCIITGISLGGIGQIEYKVNGFSASIFANYTQIHNGIQLAMFNDSYKMTGLQIGLANSSKKTKGIQIGLWNINEHRKLPIINWSFK